MAGLWEFPGGKLRVDETPEATVIRELEEEIGILTDSSCLAPLAFASHDYGEFHLLMHLYVCRIWSGTPSGREGQELAWVRSKDLPRYAMPPANAVLIALLADWL